MTKAEHIRIVTWRLRILNWAQGEPRQVARTCRHFGISRTAFYRWKKRFDELGEAVREGPAWPSPADGCEVSGAHSGDAKTALSVHCYRRLYPYPHIEGL